MPENVDTNLDNTELVVTEPMPVSVSRAPSEVLKEATQAAKALKQVLDSKKKKVRFNGEQYLEFEDWQTVGKFYGVTVRIAATSPVEIGGVSGYEARAEVIDKSGMIVSAAEAMCLNDERNWSKKPLFQLRSMAQTRASAKALRNVLAWVVVLAGYKPTPAEEMDEVFNGQQQPAPTPQGPNKPTLPSRGHFEVPLPGESPQPNGRGKIIVEIAELEETIYGESNMSARKNARKKYGLQLPNGTPTDSFTDADHKTLQTYKDNLVKRSKEDGD